MQCHDQRIESNQQFIRQLKGSLESVLAEYQSQKDLIEQQKQQIKKLKQQQRM